MYVIKINVLLFIITCQVPKPTRGIRSPPSKLKYSDTDILIFIESLYTLKQYDC